MKITVDEILAAEGKSIARKKLVLTYDEWAMRWNVTRPTATRLIKSAVRLKRMRPGPPLRVPSPTRPGWTDVLSTFEVVGHGG